MWNRHPSFCISPTNLKYETEFIFSKALLQYVDGKNECPVEQAYSKESIVVNRYRAFCSFYRCFVGKFVKTLNIGSC